MKFLSPVYTKKTTCRLCASQDLSVAIQLKPTPLANDFRLIRAEAESLESIPLEVAMCESCGHFQLGVVVDPENLFSEYLYSTGTSWSFRKHFKELAESAAQIVDSAGALAVDIGSNDGTLLAAFQSEGFVAVGIEPSRNHVSAARASGLDVLEGFLSETSVAEIVDRHGGASVVTANNVFAHIDDLQGAFRLARDLLLPGGYLLFEVSYFVDVLNETLFDTIYHEHLDYHTLIPLVAALADQDLQLVDVHHLKTHGGSVRVIARRGNGFNVDDRLTKAIMEEERILQDPHHATRKFIKAIDDSKSRFWDEVDSASAGESAGGYSAPAKATTLIHQYGLTAQHLAWVVDDNPLKQDRYLPGIGVPIVSSAKLESAPSHMPLIIFAWNLANELAERAIREYEWQGSIINPAPLPSK